MDSLSIITLGGLIGLAVLAVIFLKVRQKDLLGAIMQKRQQTAKLVTRAVYIEGVNEMPVALSLTDQALYYENPDLDASFDLDRIDEVEYTDDLMTGHQVAKGCRVLRLRSHGTTFEFVLDPADCSKWTAVLPPHRMDEPTKAAV